MASRTARLTALVAAGLLAASVLAACGGDGDADQAATEPSEPDGSDTTVDDDTIEPLGPEAVVIAHRGASGYAPEHTFAAYDLAVEQGADYLEQDLQLTADGELVVLHDEDLDRTARGPDGSCTGSARTKTLDQLRECEVGSWFNETHPELADTAFDGLPIPTLREIFERYGTDVRYYIETKAPDDQPGLERALLDLIEEFELTEPAAESSQVIIQSFSAASLQLIHDRQPELPLVLLLPVSGDPIPTAVFDDATEYAIGIGPNAINVDAALVDAAHERCLVVHPYTVDDPDEMATLLDAGVDGMFTNTPDVLLAERETTSPPPEICP